MFIQFNPVIKTTPNDFLNTKSGYGDIVLACEKYEKESLI